MLLVHANWSQGALHLWAEVPGRWVDPGALAGTDPGRADMHPYAADAGVLRAHVERLLSAGGRTGAEDRSVDGASDSFLVLRLPAHAGVPAPSPTVAHAVGHAVADPDSPLPSLAEFRVP